MAPCMGRAITGMTCAWLTVGTNRRHRSRCNHVRNAFGVILPLNVPKLVRVSTQILADCLLDTGSMILAVLQLLLRAAYLCLPESLDIQRRCLDASSFIHIPVSTRMKFSTVTS